MKTLVVEGVRVVVSDRDLVGAGGEALVYGLPDGRVAKVFHAPTPEHREKVRALVGLRTLCPDEVVVPDAELCDESGAFVGYAMARVPAGFVPLCELLRKPSFVTVGVAVRAALWRALRGVVERLHALSIVVGDLSDQNVFVDPAAGAVRIIDADSFQIGGLACPVQTDAYVDPLVAAGRSLAPSHDVYALHVLAVRMLLGVHPYGGTHPVHATVAARAAAGVFVVDASVKYPDKVAEPPLVIGRAMLAALDAFFRRPGRVPVADALVADVVRCARVCAGCGRPAVLDHGACPRCAAVAASPLRSEPTDDGLVVDFTFRWLDAVGDSVAALEQMPDAHRLHVSTAPGVWSVLTTSAAPLTCVLLSERRVAVATGGDVEVWDLRAREVVARTTTEASWGGPVLGRLGDALVRSSAGRLVVGDVVLGRPVERLLGDVVRQQARIFSSGAGGARIVVATRMGGQLSLERIDGRGRTTLPLTKLAVGEVLDDLDVLDDGATTMCLRAVRQGGAGHVRHDLFGPKGNLVASSRVASTLHPSRVGVRGRAFRGAVVLHPTSDGIIRESITHGGVGDASLVDGTRAVVDDGSWLAATSRGLVVATDGRLVHLRPTV